MGQNHDKRTEEEIEQNKQDRLCELEDRALSLFADKLDFNVLDWLDEEDKKVYVRLYKELNGFCLECGEENPDCHCEVGNG